MRALSADLLHDAADDEASILSGSDERPRRDERHRYAYSHAQHIHVGILHRYPATSMRLRENGGVIDDLVLLDDGVVPRVRVAPLLNGQGTIVIVLTASVCSLVLDRQGMRSEHAKVPIISGFGDDDVDLHGGILA